MQISVTETDSMKITSCYATAHADLVTGHRLLCRGGNQGSMEWCKCEDIGVVVVNAVALPQMGSLAK